MGREGGDERREKKRERKLKRILNLNKLPKLCYMLEVRITFIF